MAREESPRYLPINVADKGMFMFRGKIYQGNVLSTAPLTTDETYAYIDSHKNNIEPDFWVLDEKNDLLRRVVKDKDGEWQIGGPINTQEFLRYKKEHLSENPFPAQKTPDYGQNIDNLEINDLPPGAREPRRGL